MKEQNKKKCAILLGLLVISLSACSEEKPKKLTAMEQARAKIEKHNKKYEGPKQQAKKKKVGMPDWAPAGFPYPEQTILRFHSGNHHGGVINLTSNFPLDKMNEFYLGKMPEDGWVKGSTQKRKYYYLFKKIDKEAIITLSKEPGEERKTRIKITIVM